MLSKSTRCVLIFYINIKFFTLCRLLPISQFHIASSIDIDILDATYNNLRYVAGAVPVHWAVIP